jgi:hypothetical protein
MFVQSASLNAHRSSARSAKRPCRCHSKAEMHNAMRAISILFYQERSSVTKDGLAVHEKC